MTVCLPVLTLVTLATIESSAMIFLQQSLSIAAYEGARISLVPEAEAAKVRSRPWVAQVIVVLTDGRHNTGSRPERAAELAADQGIAVNTITFSAEADRFRMRKVASHGGGKHFHAVDGPALNSIYGHRSCPPDVANELNLFSLERAICT